MARVLQIYAAEQLWRQQVAAAFATLPLARLTGTAAYNPPDIPAGGSTSTTVAVVGAVFGQQAAAAFSRSLAGLYLTASVSAADTVTVTFVNPTASPINLVSGTLSAFVWVD